MNQLATTLLKPVLRYPADKAGIAGGSVNDGGSEIS